VAKIELLFIGIYVQELNRELSDHFGVKEGNGLLISKIEEKSPAAEAGLEVGDVIVKAEGQRVESTRELSEIIQDKEKGEEIEIEFLRDNKTKKADVKIEENEGSFQYEDYGEKYREYSKKYSKEAKKRMRRINEEVQKRLKRVDERYRCMRV